MVDGLILFVPPVCRGFIFIDFLFFYLMCVGVVTISSWWNPVFWSVPSIVSNSEISHRVIAEWYLIIVLSYVTVFILYTPSSLITLVITGGCVPSWFPLPDLDSSILLFRCKCPSSTVLFVRGLGDRLPWLVWLLVCMKCTCLLYTSRCV